MDRLISEQAVIDRLTRWYSDMLETGKEQEDLIEVIRAIPSAEPKTGHWIMPVNDDGMSDPIYYHVRCSKCGFDLDPQTWYQELHQYGADKYCPSCGTKMVEEQESEDKE